MLPMGICIMDSVNVRPVRVDFVVPVRPDLVVPRFAYVYVIEGDPVCLVDTGVAGAEARIAEVLVGMGHKLADVGTVVLTHSHPDHIGAAAAIQAASKATVWAHRNEQAWIENPDKQAQERPVPGFAQLVSGAVRVDRLLAEGDRVTLGAAGEFVVWHTPGHSAGSISLVQPETGTVFCGDVVPQPGGMPVYEDVVALAHSLVRLLGLTSLNRLYSAWAEPLVGPAAARAIRDGLTYLGAIDQAVRGTIASDPLACCRECVARLGLPPGAVNPLVARSFASHRQPGVHEQLGTILAAQWREE